MEKSTKQDVICIAWLCKGTIFSPTLQSKPAWTISIETNSTTLDRIFDGRPFRRTIRTEVLPKATSVGALESESRGKSGQPSLPTTIRKSTWARLLKKKRLLLPDMPPKRSSVSGSPRGRSYVFNNSAYIG